MFNKETKVAQRRKEFKKTFDPEEAKQKREQQAFSIRKSKRDENLQKRRNIGASGAPTLGSDEAFQQVCCDTVSLCVVVMWVGLLI
jgi:hypothetical protein